MKDLKAALREKYKQGRKYRAKNGMSEFNNAVKKHIEKGYYISNKDKKRLYDFIMKDNNKLADIDYNSRVKAMKDKDLKNAKYLK